MKENKGITLVALIITIIVLLILAVVTISAVNEGKLFSYANNAATSYSGAAEKENTMITNYVDEIKKHEPNQEQTSVNKWHERGITNVQIGEDKKYYCADTGLGESMCIYLTADGCLCLAETPTDEEFFQRPSNDIDESCDFTTPNRMVEGDDYYIFEGNTITIRWELEDLQLHVFTATLQE